MLEGDDRPELPTSDLPEADPPLLDLVASLAHIEQPRFFLVASYAGARRCDGLLHSTRSAVLKPPPERQCGKAAAWRAGQLLGSALWPC